MICEAGVRFNRLVYVSFQLDPDSGDMFVTIELKSNEGELFVISGQVQWDE